MRKTAFISHEKCFWHFGGNYALLSPVGGLVQPLVAGGLPEAPETKRRLKNLIEVTGLDQDLEMVVGQTATIEDLALVHPKAYLDKFKSLSDNGGGELGLRTPFGAGAFEIAMLSVGMVIQAVQGVARGTYDNAYALSRPPGHHCLPDWPNGFCLLANIAIAVERAIADGLVRKVAILDWDVHHGNGTEAIFYDRPDVLTISIHQENCFPPGSGSGRGVGFACAASGQP